jgi:hypothetical protein
MVQQGGAACGEAHAGAAASQTCRPAPAKYAPIDLLLSMTQ